MLNPYEAPSGALSAMKLVVEIARRQSARAQQLLAGSASSGPAAALALGFGRP